MIGRPKTIVIAGMITASLVCASPLGAFANDELGYSHDSSINYSAPDWMTDIPGTTPLNQLSIPGTHDTMSTGPGGDSTQNQSMSLTTQLESGIRFLDIRLLKKPDDNQLYLHHGPVFLDATIDDVMHDVSDFLTKHPTETVLMRIQQEWSNQPIDQFTAALRLHVEPYADQLWTNSGQGVNTPLEKLWGKIVLFPQGPKLPWGMPYGESAVIQDNYNLISNEDLYNKWTAVKNQVNAAADSSEQSQASSSQASHSQANQTNGSLYLNYLSGSGGSFPYFVASGKINASTYAPLLSTGLTTPAFGSWYPDFPRTSCFLGVCTISYAGTNQLTANYLRKNSFNTVGIVIADFPGSALIDAVIAANHR